MTKFDLRREEPAPARRSDAWSRLGQLTGFPEPEAKVRMPGFALHLGDGSRWWIAASPQVSPLVEEMATIMHLEEGEPEDAHLIFFFERHANSGWLELPRLQAQGWSSLRPLFLHMFYVTIYLQIYFHPRWRHFLGEYDHEDPQVSTYGMMWGALPSVYWESIHRGGLPFHAAFIEYQGQGVILAAAGGTGKSTCSRRVPPPWRARCDDEVLVVLSPQGRYLAHPFPTWTDYILNRAPNTWKVQEAVPLAGIFFFEQAAEDDCLPLKGAAAAAAACSSADQAMGRFLKRCGAEETREIRQAMFASACKIVKQIPAFRLKVSLNGSFWEKIEAALGWR